MESFNPTDLCEDLVCCVICFEPFSDSRIPKALPCLHTFCSDCLSGSIEAYRSYPKKNKTVTNKHFPCPVCKESIRIPENGLNGFKDDFRIRRISEIFSKVKVPEPDPKAGNQNKTCDVCKFFKKEIPAPLYCLECSKMLCKSCSEKHLMMSIAKDHNIVDAKSNVSQAGEATCSEHDGEVMRYFCRDCNQSLCSTCTFTDEHTNHKVVELAEESSKAKEELTDLIGTCRRNLPELKTNMSEFDRLEQHLLNREKLAQKAILVWTLEEMSKIRKEQTKMEEELSKMCRGKGMELTNGRQKTQVHLEEMTPCLDLMDRMVKSGQDVQIVSAHGENASRLRTFAAFKGPKPPEEGAFCDLGRFDSLIEQYEDDINQDVADSGDSILKEIKTVASKMNLIEDDFNRIKVHRLKMFGKKGSKDGQFHFPSSVAFSPVNGDIVVADLNNGRIQIFNKDGEFQRKFGSQGFKPCGVVVRKDGDIAVTDTCNNVNCIKVYSPTGIRKSSFGQGAFNYPFSIALDSKERYIVSDSAKNEIVIIDDKGRPVHHFPTRTKFAFYLAVNSKDQILSSDWYHHCVRVFDMQGNLLNRIGTRGFDKGQLMIPLGICIGPNDFLYILDCKCQRVAVFSSDGNFVKNILEDKKEGIEYSRAIAISKDSRLVVTYGDNKRDVPNEVKLYQMEITSV